MRRTEIWGMVLRSSDIRAASRRNFMLRVAPAQPTRAAAPAPLPMPPFLPKSKRSRAPEPRRDGSKTPPPPTEISGSGGTRLREFYAKVFGRLIDAARLSGLVETAENARHDGIREEPAVPPGRVVYIQTGDLQATLDAICEAGGSTLLPPTEVPGLVTFALFKDPAGNVMGLMKG